MQGWSLRAGVDHLPSINKSWIQSSEPTYKHTHTHILKHIGANLDAAIFQINLVAQYTW